MFKMCSFFLDINIMHSEIDQKVRVHLYLLLEAVIVNVFHSIKAYEMYLYS